MKNKSTASARWDRLSLYRTQYLDRAIECSRLTIPSLVPDSSLVSSRSASGVGAEELESLYQGAGARGVNNISAKLLLALYPASQPFFRLMLDMGQLEAYSKQTGAQLNDDFVSTVDQALAQMERSVLQKMERLSLRAVLFEAVKHLVVSGNGLLYIGQDGARFYGLRSFCCDRDPEGNWREIVIKEELGLEFLPAKAREKAQSGGKDDDESMAAVDVYTHIQMDPDRGRVEWYQECLGDKLPGSAGFSNVETCPWVPLRLHRIAGESYGRSLVEEVLGDLNSLELLSQAVVEGNLAMAMGLILVNPNGVTRADTLSRAKNWAFVTGNPNDVAMLTLDKSREFASAMQNMQMIERRLQFTFMSTESIQRDAERVTAEEIRLMAEQLEQNLGGIYSILSQEMQLPMLRRVMNLMEKAGELQNTPSEFVSPQITTGMDAIGRGNDRARLAQFLQVLAATLGPDALIRYIKPSELISRFAASDGIDVKGLVKTEQELQAEQAQAQKLELEQSLVQNELTNAASTAQRSSGAQPPAAGQG